MFKLEEKIKEAEDKLQRVKHEKDAQMEELKVSTGRCLLSTQVIQ